MWDECGTACPMTCDGKQECDDDCVPSCVCDEDHPYRHEGKCVKVEICYDGRFSMKSFNKSMNITFSIVV